MRNTPISLPPTGEKTDQEIIADWMRGIFDNRYLNESDTSFLCRDPTVFPDLICVADRKIYRHKHSIQVRFFPMKKGRSVKMDLAPYDLRVTFNPVIPYNSSTTCFEIFDTGGLGELEFINRIKKFLLFAKLREG